MWTYNFLNLFFYFVIAFNNFLFDILSNISDLLSNLLSHCLIWLLLSFFPLFSLFPFFLIKVFLSLLIWTEGTSRFLWVVLWLRWPGTKSASLSLLEVCGTLEVLWSHSHAWFVQVLILWGALSIRRCSRIRFLLFIFTVKRILDTRPLLVLGALATRLAITTASARSGAGSITGGSWALAIVFANIRWGGAWVFWLIRLTLVQFEIFLIWLFNLFFGSIPSFLSRVFGFLSHGSTIAFLVSGIVGNASKLELIESSESLEFS